MPLDGKLSGRLNVIGGTLKGALSGVQSLTGGLSAAAGIVPLYEGEYDFTPSGEPQTVSIAGLKAAQDIIIEAIPDNYGLITWDGSVITVS